MAKFIDLKIISILNYFFQFLFKFLLISSNSISDSNYDVYICLHLRGSRILQTRQSLHNLINREGKERWLVRKGRSHEGAASELAAAPRYRSRSGRHCVGSLGRRSETRQWIPIKTAWTMRCGSRARISPSRYRCSSSNRNSIRHSDAAATRALSISPRAAVLGDILRDSRYRADVANSSSSSNTHTCTDR